MANFLKKITAKYFINEAGVVKWSASSPSTPMTGVQITLKSTNICFSVNC